MKKNIFSFLTLALTFPLLSGQVGINTSNPRAAFHIDGGKDNPLTGDPSAIQQDNDFVVTSSGKIGIGTINPETGLEINNGTIKIVNGSQAKGRVLTSDENGIGSWGFPASPLYQMDLTGRPDFTIPANSNDPLYTGVAITLPPGKFMIMINLGLEMGTLNGYTVGTNFVRLRLKDSISDNTILSPDATYPKYASVGSSLSQNKALLAGSLAINNKSTGNKTYYLFADTTGSTGAQPFVVLKFTWNETSIIYQKVQ